MHLHQAFLLVKAQTEETLDSNLKHIFVRAPLDETRRAWEQQHGTAIEGDVHFIPAQGGCFVVASNQRDAALPRPLQVIIHGHAEAPVERELARFKDRIEAGEALTRAPRTKVQHNKVQTTGASWASPGVRRFFAALRES